MIALANRVVPAPIVMWDHAFGFQRTMLIATAARLNVADHLADGPKTAEELAKLIGRVNVDALHRTLRALASLGIFDLDRRGHFSNNRLSESLRVGVPASINSWAKYCGSKSNIAAWADYEESVATGKNAFERVHGKDCWAHFAEHADEGATFAQSMVDLTDLQGPLLAGAYPFSEIDLLCDVAGGRGALLASVLQRHRHTKSWLFDEPQVLEGARPFLEQRGVAHRVELKPGNMFSEVPKGASAYMLKDILHDWDDERSKLILSNVRCAMERGQRILLAEILVDKNETTLPGPIIDCHMLTVCAEGRQRSADDFRTLFAETGFKLERIVPTAAPASIVEGVAT
jgi:hypothetical protein